MGNATGVQECVLALKPALRLDPSPGCLPDPGIKPGFPALQSNSLLSEPPEKGQSPVLAGGFFNSSTTREALNNC